MCRVHSVNDLRWIEVRAVMVKAGDITPAGRVVAVELWGEILSVWFEVEGGQYFTRRFDDLVSVFMKAGESE